MKNVAEENRSQKRSRRTRKKLKKAALNVFSEKSVDAATVEEITEKADVGKGTLYNHFSDKEEIMVTLVNDSFEHLIEKIRSLESDLESFSDMLEHLLDTHYQFLVEAKKEFLILFQGKLLLKLESDGMTELEPAYSMYLGEIDRQIDKYLPGKMKEEKIRSLSCAIAGFVFGFFSFAMIGMKKEELERNRDLLKHCFIKSMCDFVSESI